MTSLVRTFALVSLFAQLGHAALFIDPALVNATSYDYIVVGAGVGGSTTAGRLAENRNERILLIEAGISNEGVQNIIVPFFAFFTSPNTALTWNYTTTPQEALHDRTLLLPQGRLLGGGSSMNLLVYSRGPSDDYDHIAEVTGDSSWKFKNIFPYLTKHEKWTPPRDGHNTTVQFDPHVHGYKGNIKVTLANHPTPIDGRIIQTVSELPEFEYVKDMNSGNPLGFGWMQSITGGGARSSAATAYLTGQSNLDILLLTTATRLVQDGVKNGVPYFNKVEVASSPSAPRFTLQAKKEIILSAGAVATPKLLMLSGIGPQAALSALNITTIIDSKDVGANYQDHPILSHPFEANTNFTFEDTIANIPALLPEWETNKTGPLTIGLTNHLGWTRLDQNDTYLQTYPEMVFGSHTPHIEYSIANGFASFANQAPGQSRYLSMFTGAVKPTSRGSVTLASTDPFENPIINPNMLSTPGDLHVMVEATKGVRRFLSAPVWQDYVIQPHESARIDINNDTAIEEYVRQYTTSTFHPSGTAAISSFGSSDGVVDPKLCLKGAAGVRIVDASVFPHIPAAHPQAAIFGIAEKAADMIKSRLCNGKQV